MKYTIKDLPPEMRPREKMLLRGAQELTEGELLAIILNSGSKEMNSLQVAQHLLGYFKGLRHLKAASIEEIIASAKGVGEAKAIAIKAALELGARIPRLEQEQKQIKSPLDVVNLLMEEMRYFDREHFCVLYLDRKSRLIASEDISIGGLHSAAVHPREVFKSAIKRSSASIILAHNHPSGDPEPSAEDIRITERLVEAGQLLGIEVSDHIVLGDGRYKSLKASGLM
jgi:DNA repair protein RadC